MASRKPGFTARLNRRLAKAESVLILVLLIDILVEWWLYPYPRLDRWAKTVIVMALAVGIFGVVLGLVSRYIDRTMSATRKVTKDYLLVPTLLFHLVFLTGLFFGFYWAKWQVLPFGWGR